MCVSASASSFDGPAAELSAIGMLKGGANGFDLDKVPTRTQAAIMLVRLFGAEDEAKATYAAGDIQCPFGDVSETAAPYVAWLTDRGLANGVAEGSFGALNGVLFADEVNWERDWLDEARRYYQTACQMEPGNPEFRQALNFVENNQAGYRPEGYEVFSSGCGGDNMCGRLACTYLLCNLCGCGGMRFFWC